MLRDKREKKFVQVAVMAAVGVALAMGAAMAADYPKRKPITIVVPFKAGGGSDNVARVVAPELAAILGQDVIVKNIGGAGGTIGTADAAAAKGDGYTLGYIPVGPMVSQPHLRNLPFGLESFKYVCRITDGPIVLMTPKESGFKTVDDVVKGAKAKPNKLVFTGPVGSVPYISMLAFNGAWGLKMKTLPLNSADTAKNMAGGLVHFHAAQPNVMGRYDLHGITFFSGERLAEYPDIPAAKESGHDLQYSIWAGLNVPSSTPDDVVAVLEEACAKAVKTDRFIKNMKRVQAPIAYQGVKDYTAFVKEQFATYGDILTKAGLKK